MDLGFITTADLSQVNNAHEKLNLIKKVTVTIKSTNKQHFSIFVIELLDKDNALYKPCSEFEGYFKDAKVMFECNEGKGHFGDFVYIRDERPEHEHFGLCEVK